MNIQRNLELQMVKLVNDVRMKYGLHHLDYCDGLCTIARKHSLDQLQSDNIFHVSKRTGTPQDRMIKSQYPYVSFGENVAMGQKMERLHQKLLKSEGHFKNIVHTDFSHIGIGILANKKKQLFITQLFSKKLRTHTSYEVIGYVKNQVELIRRRFLPIVSISVHRQISQYLSANEELNDLFVNKIEQIIQPYPYRNLKVHFQTFNDLSTIEVDYSNHPNLSRIFIGLDQSSNQPKILLVYLFS